MAKDSKIEWCDHTFNPWVGCQKISPACANCYAEAWAKRAGRDFSTPARTSAANWREPLKWNREAKGAERRPRVFCASLADVFDNRVPVEWRADLFALIRATPNLDWLIVTKRIGNAESMLPSDWGDGYLNTWLIITVANQTEYERDVFKLVKVPAFIKG
jgi:protein gp37